MKIKLHRIAFLLLLVNAGTSQAAIVVPGAKGTDGELNITAATVIDLSQAVTGVWDADGRLDRVEFMTRYRDSSGALLVANHQTIISLPADGPQVKIVSIKGQRVPDDPFAAFGTSGVDAILSQTATTEVVIGTTHLESSAQLKLRATLRTDSNLTEVAAAPSSTVSNRFLVLHSTATLPTKSSYSLGQVKVIRS